MKSFVQNPNCNKAARGLIALAMLAASLLSPMSIGNAQAKGAAGGAQDKSATAAASGETSSQIDHARGVRPFRTPKENKDEPCTGHHCNRPQHDHDH